MNKRWLALLKTRDLTCHLCGLLILARKDLSGDHWPVPRSKGGTQRKPAHKWCDHAHEDRVYIYATDLQRLIDAWKSHGVRYSNRVYASLKALEEKERV